MKKSRILTALRGVWVICMVALLLFFCAVDVFAVDPTESAGGGGFESSTIATGTKQLLSDVASWLTGIGLTVGTVAAVYCLIRKSMADEVDGKMWNKRLVTAIICAVAVALVGGIIALISSYYGG